MNRIALMLLAALPASFAFGGTMFEVDLSGVEFWDNAGDPDNVVLPIDLNSVAGASSPVTVIGIGWDLTQTSFGGSWLDDQLIDFDWDGDGISDLSLNPSSTQAPGASESNSSSGIVYLDDLNEPLGAVPTGIVSLEFFEIITDLPNQPDGILEQGSILRFELAGGIPEPTSIALCVAAGLAMLTYRLRSARRRR